MIRRSIGRAVARRAAQRESSSASSRVSCECLPLFHAGMELSPCPFWAPGEQFQARVVLLQWSWGGGSAGWEWAKRAIVEGRAGSSRVGFWIRRDCCTLWGRALIYGSCQLSKKKNK